MSPEVFLTLIAVYVVLQVAVLLFVRTSDTTQEERDRRRMSEDISRMRQLEDIRYYKEVFRDKGSKD